MKKFKPGCHYANFDVSAVLQTFFVMPARASTTSHWAKYMLDLYSFPAGIQEME